MDFLMCQLNRHVYRPDPMPFFRTVYRFDSELRLSFPIQRIQLCAVRSQAYVRKSLCFYTITQADLGLRRRQGHVLHHPSLALQYRYNYEHLPIFVDRSEDETWAFPIQLRFSSRRITSPPNDPDCLQRRAESHTVH